MSWTFTKAAGRTKRWVPIVMLLGLSAATTGWLLERPAWRLIVSLYVVTCWGAAIAALFVWVRHRSETDSTDRLIANHTRAVDMVEQLGVRPSGSLLTHLASQLPGNQVFKLYVQDKTVRLPRLHPDLDGLTIAHLSDLHLTDRVTRPFYELIVQETRRIDLDLIVISGDIIDKPRCLAWLPDLLGDLTSRHGTFFVLGNHDLRIRDELGLRRRLGQLGLTDLGRRWELISVRGRPMLLAGNELGSSRRGT